MSDEPYEEIDRLRESKAISFDEFDDRVRDEAAFVEQHLDAGTFDNEQVAIGLEYEFYALDRGDYTLRRLPRALLNGLGFERELGLHNAELNTGVQPGNAAGFEALLKEVEAKVRSIETRATDEDIRLVSDGVWTIGPAESTTPEYLTEATHEEGLTLAINVSNAVRYHGFASSRRPITGRAELPGATVAADNPGPVSLTSSIQPHYQFRRAADLPDHLGSAIRLAGPLLALGVNSPFLPPDLYDRDPDRDLLLEASWAENRIPLYEEVMNPIDGPPKVRFPEDVATPAEAVSNLVEDAALVPANIDAGERFDADFVHLRHKHGSYWRWVRPVFEGASESAANVRIEFRPLPGQPTIPDTVSLLVAFVGLLTEFHERDHPARGLDWETARDNFYAAARDGLDADFEWVTADGDRTTDSDRLFADLLDTAADGLARRGLSESQADGWLDPLRERAERKLSPAEWKRRHVAKALDDGQTPAEAIHGMQRAYIDRQAETLYSGHLVDWPTP